MGEEVLPAIIWCTRGTLPPLTPRNQGLPPGPLFEAPQAGLGTIPHRHPPTDAPSYLGRPASWHNPMSAWAALWGDERAGVLPYGCEAAPFFNTPRCVLFAIPPAHQMVFVRLGGGSKQCNLPMLHTYTPKMLDETQAGYTITIGKDAETKKAKQSS